MIVFERDEGNGQKLVGRVDGVLGDDGRIRNAYAVLERRGPRGGRYPIWSGGADSARDRASLYAQLAEAVERFQGSRPGG